MQIVMPMAGRGQRFKDAGYTEPKPFINIDGTAMYRRAMAPFVSEVDRVILITQEDHQPHFAAEPNYIHHSDKVFLSGPTEGAACSVLAARAFIDNYEPLLIVNCDQLIEFNRFNWAVLANNSDADGIIFTFLASGPKWSYVALDPMLRISQVAEKVEISSMATCGAYWWREGREFCKAADKMIADNTRTNNEFYVAPVYNELLKLGGNVYPFMVDEMISLGTPEFLADYRKLGRIRR